MKTLVVDDHVLIREAMRGIVAEVFPGYEMLEAKTGAEALRVLDTIPDVALVLLDLTLPDGSGLDILADMRARHPSVPVAAISALCDRDTVMKTLEAGAVGFIPKAAAREVLIGALRIIAAGSVYVPPDILANWAPRQQGPETVVAVALGLAPGDLGLTDRQVDVLALMMKGKSNKLICRALGLAEPTVKNHVSAILRALGASNRTEAVLSASAHGWVFPDRS